MWTRFMVLTVVRLLIDRSKKKSDNDHYSLRLIYTSSLVILGGGDPHCIIDELVVGGTSFCILCKRLR